MYKQRCNSLQAAILPPGEQQQHGCLGELIPPSSALLWPPRGHLLWPELWAHAGTGVELSSSSPQNHSYPCSYPFISSVFPIIWDRFMATGSSISSPHLPATHCFPAPGFLLVTLSPVTLSVCASSPSWCFCPASRNHYIFTHPAITNSASPGQGDFSHLALLSAYSKYLHNILSM